jgi:putative transposase
MRRLSPSVMARTELEELITRGVAPGDNLVSSFVELVTRLVAQELLEAEQTDVLGGRGRYERRQDARGQRNGYRPSHLRTAEGDISLRVPQVRDVDEPFRPALLSFLEGNSEVLERLVCEMYARGLSTRDIEDSFRAADGTSMLSRTAVSEVTDRLWEDYGAFLGRDLSELSIHYLFCDAVFESLRRYGAKEAVLVCWGIDAEGRKHLLHLAIGNKESERDWTEFFRHMVRRGLRPPTSVTSDGAPGLIKAIESVFSGSIRIRCWFHRMANLRSKITDEAAPEVMAEVRAIRDAPNLEAARAQVHRVTTHFSRQFPSAIACLDDDLEALLAIHRLPVRHRLVARTTNLAERSFEEERRRSKVIARFSDERAAMKLVFATLLRCELRWNRVSISELERRQLDQLRTELGLDPPPAGSTEKKRRGRTANVA